MKFIELKSRGGNYLVVADNVAWLRDYENGQVQVGMVGGAPLLIVGKLEEIAASILEQANSAEYHRAGSALSHPRRSGK